jgi:hypothetical protein
MPRPVLASTTNPMAGTHAHGTAIIRLEPKAHRPTGLEMGSLPTTLPSSTDHLVPLAAHRMGPQSARDPITNKCPASRRSG